MEMDVIVLFYSLIKQEKAALSWLIWNCLSYKTAKLDNRYIQVFIIQSSIYHLLPPPLYYATLTLTPLFFVYKISNFTIFYVWFSPSFICHPHYPPTFLPVPKVAYNCGKTVIRLILPVQLWGSNPLFSQKSSSGVVSRRSTWSG